MASRLTRMFSDQFDHLLALVEALIIKKKKNFRDPILAPERLSLRLHYLASGESLQPLFFSYRMGKTTVSMVICETCNAICEALSLAHLKPPILQKIGLAFQRIFSKSGTCPM